MPPTIKMETLITVHLYEITFHENQKKNLAHNTSFLIFGWFQKIRKLMKIGIALTNIMLLASKNGL